MKCSTIMHVFQKVFLTICLIFSIVSCDLLTLPFAKDLNNPVDPNTSSSSSTEKAITDFIFTDLSISGVINEISHTILISVPYGTDITVLTPKITITGKSISPASDVTQDFTEPVTYTVRAIDNSKQNYEISVKVLENSDKFINSFTFFTPAAQGEIDEGSHTISVKVPTGTSLTMLSPAITHSGSSINPPTGVSQDFSKPVTYTVTAFDGTIQNYLVTVSELVSTEKAINSLNFVGVIGNGIINQETHTITITVPFGTNVLSLIPSINYSGLSISPKSGIAQNFTDPITYTVTASDGSSQGYSVILTIALNPAKTITDFSFPTSVSTTITESTHTISVIIPSGTNLTSLTPTISYTGTFITPSSGLTQDFTFPKIYEVTAEDGSSQTYTISVKADSLISTFAGTGVANFSGDGSQAINSSFNNPSDIVSDSLGNIYIADYYNQRIRKIDTNGIISTYAGDGGVANLGDGGLATSASIYYPEYLAIDSSNNLYITSGGGNRIRKVTSNGYISTIAGNGIAGFSGDGGLATSANLKYPKGIAVDGEGNVYIADNQNNRIRKVSTDGIINTIAGTGVAGFSGDGGPATSARLYQPGDVEIDSLGNILIADYWNNRIRKISSDGKIITVVGTGIQGYSGDGSLALSTSIYAPTNISVDSNGNVYFNDLQADSIREVLPSGTVTTIAGVGSSGYSGDGGSALLAKLKYPRGILVNTNGDIFIADVYNHVIRKISH